MLNLIVDLFKEHRNLTVKSNERTVLFGKNGAKRIAYKQDTNDKKQNSVYVKMKDVFENAVYYKDIPADEKNKKRVAYQERYLSKIYIDDKPYIVRFKVDAPLNPEEQTSTYNYAGHRVSAINIAPDVSQFSTLYSSSATNSITDVSKDLNPNVTKHEDKNVIENIPVDNSGYSIKLVKSQRVSTNMEKAMANGFYPEEQVRITLPKNTKEGKRLSQLFEENKTYKTNYKVSFAYSDNKYNDY